MADRDLEGVIAMTLETWYGNEPPPQLPERIADAIRAAGLASPPTVSEVG